MLKSENRKAIVAFIGSIVSFLAVLGIDAGGLWEIFTEDRIDVLAAAMTLAVLIARSVWEVPNLPSVDPRSTPVEEPRPLVLPPEATTPPERVAPASTSGETTP